MAILSVLLISKCDARGLCSEEVGGPRHEIQMFAGYSPDSSTLIGTAPDRRLAMAGLSYGYRCWEAGAVSVSYNASVMPAAALRVPAQTVYSFTPPYQRRAAAHWVHGVGITPIGLMAELSRRRVRPFLDGIGGIIASTEPIPENQPNASGLNFLFAFGGGVRWHFQARRAVTLGYRFLHISNAGTTNFNPGVDNNVFYLGYSFLR